MGSSVLHTWPTTLAEVDDRFNDETKIDTSVLWDDSAGRRVVWANYATTLGAALVLLAYSWGVPPAEDYESFTARGFDRINRTFVMTEPGSVAGEGLDPIQPEDEVGWEPADAAWLRYHRWHALDARPYAIDTPPTLAIDGDAVRIHSPAGIRVLVHLVDGRRRADEQHLDAAPSTTIRIPIADLRDLYPGSGTVTIKAIDDDGNVGWINVQL